MILKSEQKGESDDWWTGYCVFGERLPVVSLKRGESVVAGSDYQFFVRALDKKRLNK